MLVVSYRYVLVGALFAAACNGAPTTSSDQNALTNRCGFGGQTYGSGCGSGNGDAGIIPDSGSDDVDAGPDSDGGIDGGDTGSDAGVGGDAGTGVDDGGIGGGGDAGDGGGGAGDDGGVGGGDGGAGSGGGGDAGVGGNDAGTDGGAGDDGGVDGGAGSDAGGGGGGSDSCGDGSCGPGEGCDSCPSDCGACPSCGDGTCNGGESCSSCPDDCGDCTTGCSGDNPEDCKNVLQVFEETSESDRPDPSCTEVAQWLTADDFDYSAISTDYLSLESAQFDAESVDPYQIRAGLFDGSLVSFNMVSPATAQTVCSFVATWDQPIKKHWIVETPPLTVADNSSYADDPCDNGWQDDPFDCEWEEETMLDQAGGIPPQDMGQSPADPDYIIEVDP